MGKIVNSFIERRQKQIYETTPITTNMAEVEAIATEICLAYLCEKLGFDEEEVYLWLKEVEDTAENEKPNT